MFYGVTRPLSSCRFALYARVGNPWNRARYVGDLDRCAELLAGSELSSRGVVRLVDEEGLRKQNSPYVGRDQEGLRLRRTLHNEWARL